MKNISINTSEMCGDRIDVDLADEILDKIKSKTLVLFTGKEILADK